jgi:endonuclease-3
MREGQNVARIDRGNSKIGLMKNAKKAASKAAVSVNKNKGVANQAAQTLATAQSKKTNYKWGYGANPDRVSGILKGLDQAYPQATCALKHENPFQLLISTILSAQCTDERVNKVTASLYKKYPSAEAFAYASPSELEQDIRPTGFFRNKTKSIMGASRKLIDEFKGEIPQTMEQILTLPGVARKTANVVLGTAYGLALGVVVDTHVRRVSRRLDLTRHDDPQKIEQDLMAAIPKMAWINFSHQLIWHGRRVCQARKPNCMECNLEPICYSVDKTFRTHKTKPPKQSRTSLKS